MREERRQRMGLGMIIGSLMPKGDIDEREEGARKRANDVWGNDDAAGYIMDVMLRSLIVELKVIGFDPGLQRWVEWASG